MMAANIKVITPLAATQPQPLLCERFWTAETKRSVPLAARKPAMSIVSETSPTIDTRANRLAQTLKEVLMTYSREFRRELFSACAAGQPGPARV